MKINHIKIITGEVDASNNNVVRAEVYYEGKKSPKIIEDFKEIQDIIVRFAEQEGVTYEEIFMDPTKMIEESLGAVLDDEGIMEVTYPDGTVHRIMIGKVLKIEKDETYLVYGKDNGTEVVIHMARTEESFVKIPHNNKDYLILQSPLLKKKDVTSSLKPMLSGGVFGTLPNTYDTNYYLGRETIPEYKNDLDGYRALAAGAGSPPNPPNPPRTEEYKARERKEEEKIGFFARAKKKIIALTSIAAALILTFFIGGEWERNKDGLSGKDGWSYAIEEQYDYGDEVEELAVEAPYYEEAADTHDISTTYYTEAFVNYVRRLCNGEKLSSQELEYVINEINNTNYYSVVGLENFITGGVMYGAKTDDSLSMFQQGSADSVVIGEFISQRNTIIDNAVNVNSRSNTENEMSQYLTNITDFIYNNAIIGGYGYYDLSPVGRCWITDMAQQMLSAHSKYTGKINGNACSHIDLANDFAQTYNTAVQQLDSMTKSR